MTKFNKEHIDAGIKTLFEQGQVVELRVPKAGRLGTISGYFNNFTKLAEALAELSGEFEGIYYTLNPVSPDLLSRANNRWIDHAKSTTSDSDAEVLHRRWLLLDCDPKRPTGISSSDAEKRAAKIFATQIKSYLRELGWPEPVVCDSGNGYHLLYRIDLPNDSQSRDLCQKVLQVLAMKFDTKQVQLDQKVFNSSRIIKAYGTMAMKGDNTKERPHRIAMLFQPPANLTPVSREQLLALTAGMKSTPATDVKKTVSGDWTEEMVEAAYQQAGIELRGPFPWTGKLRDDGTAPTGEKWQHNCLNEPDQHKCPDAFTVLSDGWVSCTCSHNSCGSGMNTKEWIAKLEEICGERLKMKPAPILDFGVDVEPVTDSDTDEPVVESKLNEFTVRSKLRITRGDQIVMKPVEWLWDKRVPLGKITILHGGGGIGKSQAAIDIAARTTRGGSWPDGSENPHGPKFVIVAASEDDWSDTGAPRFHAAGADPTRWYALEGVQETDNMEGEWKTNDTAFRLSDHMGSLRARIEKNAGKVALIIFDPLVSFYGGKKANVEDEIRPVLEQLQKLAADCHVAIIGIAHHAKRQDVGSAVQKIAGSVALGNVTRSTWMFIPDDDEKGCFQMVRSKGNLAADVGGLKARIVGVDIPLDDDRVAKVSKVEWLGKVEGDADDALQRAKDKREGKDMGKAGLASQWLTERLGSGMVESEKIFEEGAAAGHSKRTLYRAKDELGIKATRKGGCWYWRLQDETQMPPDIEETVM